MLQGRQRSASALSSDVWDKRTLTTASTRYILPPDRNSQKSARMKSGTTATGAALLKIVSSPVLRSGTSLIVLTKAKIRVPLRDLGAYAALLLGGM